MNNQPRVAFTLLDVPIHDVTMEETLTWIERWLEADTRSAHRISTVNPEFLMQARANSTFRATLQEAALCVPDGMGILWAGRLRGMPLRERVAGSDLVPRLAAEAAQHGWRVFFLGAAPGIAEQAADILAQRNPGLCVAGCYAGSPNPVEEDDIVARVRDACTDILLVAYGAPKQDLWLARALARTGAVIGVGVGGAFDFVAGVRQRAPQWARSWGVEWLYRLLREPWRWRRQLALPRFAALVLFKRSALKRSSD